MAQTVNEALKLELKRAQGDKNVQAATTNDLNDRPVNNVAASVWNPGDQIDCSTIKPEHLKKQTFVGSDTPAYFVIVGVTDKNGNKTAKRLYFSSLTRSIAEYEQGEGEVLPKGTAKDASQYPDGQAVYNDMMGCATVGDQFAVLQTYKTLEIADVIEVETARYQNGNQLPRTRKAKLPLFKGTK